LPRLTHRFTSPNGILFEPDALRDAGSQLLGPVVKYCFTYLLTDKLHLTFMAIHNGRGKGETPFTSHARVANWSRVNWMISLHLLSVWLVALAAACSTWYRVRQ
jgi:hypothetical protein